MHKEQSNSPLASLKVGSLLNRPLEHEALRASCSRMHLYNHHVFAHSPMVLTNPEHSEFVAEHIFYALQLRVRTQTINSLCPSEKYFSYNSNIINGVHNS